MKEMSSEQRAQTIRSLAEAIKYNNMSRQALEEAFSTVDTMLTLADADFSEQHYSEVLADEYAEALKNAKEYLEDHKCTT